MDFDQKKRRQSLKLIISETIMVLAVILMVVILALIVSGYWINTDFQVERQGMLQVYSVPTGADVMIDGKTSWLQRTNTSKVLPSGEHEVSLSKEGYDTWSRTINISEGLLYRLHYPRLFLLTREVEKVYNTSGATLASVSPDRKKLLIINGTTEWLLVNLTEERVNPKKINITKYFSDVSLAEGAEVGLFTGVVESINWAKDNTHILLRTSSGDEKEWVILNINNIANSINLTKEFGGGFDKVEMLNDNASSLLVLQGGVLRKIDVGSKQISAVLAERVITFDHYDNEIVYLSQNENQSYGVNFIKNDDKAVRLQTIDTPAKVTISRFYDDKYITVLVGNQVSLYKLENYEFAAEFTLGFEPSRIKVGYAGRFVEMYSGSEVATLDMEVTEVREWQLPVDSFGWVDDNMIYTVNEGGLEVYDFDGLNRRTLAKNVSNHFPVTITDDKWLYYFSDDNLVREWLVAR